MKLLRTMKKLTGVAFLTGLALAMVLTIAPTTGRALTVSPVTLSITADPGEIVGGEISLENEQDVVKTFTSSVREFTEGADESGTPKFETSTQGISGWIDTIDEVTLQPKERRTVSFSVNVPKDARVGGHFASIFWTARGAGDGEVSLEASLGVLVFLTVRGNVVESGEVVEFGTTSGKSTFSAPPVDLFARFKNTGGDRVVPTGTVTIKNMFGGIKDTIAINEAGGSALPGSIRRYDTSWNVKGYESEASGFFDGLGRELANFSFGNYTADLALTFGETSKTAAASTSFFMFPWRTLLLVLILVIIVVIVWIWVVRSRKGKATARRT